jgi:hypothetical protein
MAFQYLPKFPCVSHTVRVNLPWSSGQKSAILCLLHEPMCPYSKSLHSERPGQMEGNSCSPYLSNPGRMSNHEPEQSV